MCKSFNVKNVPAIFMVNDSSDDNKSFLKDQFTGERTYENIEKFILKHLDKKERNTNNDNNNDSNSNDSNSTDSNSNDSNSNDSNDKESFNSSSNETINKISNSSDEVEFEKNEDVDNKNFTYCIKHKNPSKSNLNFCQNINKKETPTLKAWQAAYSTISHYLDENATTYDEKKDLAYKIKNDISNFGLCDKTILDIVKKNNKNLGENQSDTDINQAINYGCGFI